MIETSFWVDRFGPGSLVWGTYCINCREVFVLDVYTWTEYYVYVEPMRTGHVGITGCGPPQASKNLVHFATPLSGNDSGFG